MQPKRPKTGFVAREPAITIGVIGSVIVGIIGVLLGNGIISELAAGKAVDLVQSLVGFLVLLAPIITAIITRQNVTPAAAPRLLSGTTVAVVSPQSGDVVDVKTV